MQITKGSVLPELVKGLAPVQSFLNPGRHPGTPRDPFFEFSGFAFSPGGILSPAEPVPLPSPSSDRDGDLYLFFRARASEVWRLVTFRSIFLPCTLCHAAKGEDAWARTACQMLQFNFVVKRTALQVANV